MANIEKLRKARTVNRTAFTKAWKVFNEKHDGQASQRDLRVAFRMLETKMEELTTANNEFMEAMYELETSTEEAIQKEIDDADEYQRKFLEAQDIMQELYKEQGAGNSQNDCGSVSGGTVVSRQSETKKSFKLPKIELVKFSGTIREWLQFWSLFKKIHEDSSIANEEKFQYLLQAMVPGSRAAELVNSYPPTAENYSKVINSLKDRFGRDDLQIEVYVRDLLQLVLNSALRASVPLSTLFDKIESHLRALSSLGVTADKYAAMLFPLVESCLPEDLLRVWQRYSCTMTGKLDGNGKFSTEAKDRLSHLIKFLESEVRNELRISMATERFGFVAKSDDAKLKKGPIIKKSMPTATGLLTVKQLDNKCIFCELNHESANCEKAKNMTLNERQDYVKRKNACFRCLKVGHSVKTCRVKVVCRNCSYKHATIMCRAKDSTTVLNTDDRTDPLLETNCASVNNYPFVFLQTLKIKLKGRNIDCKVRALIDTGSQHSYITSSAAKRMGYNSVGSVVMNHVLFGGSRKNLVQHNKYEVRVCDVNENSFCNFVALDQDTICESVPKLQKGVWCHELEKMKIKISDMNNGDEEISILIGSDIAGKLKTGRVQQLSCGLTAEETKLGWVLSGKVIGHIQKGSAITAISMYVNECKVEELWDLETLGIKDPIQQKSREDNERLIQAEFLKSVTMNEEGRYEVPLPWTENHPPLGDNKRVALSRLQTTTRKLTTEGYYDKYDAVFQEWIEKRIIEYVPKEEENNWGHYIPHRHVIKESSTTAVRPVFDASSKSPPHPSLNDCLHKGPNLIELVSDVLLRFRIGDIGVIADIEKAFLQISIDPKDRDFLRFLWYDNDGTIKILRHRRVVFGVCCSPFILGAIIEYHLKKLLEECKNNMLKKFDAKNISLLSNSLYVDNCVTSFNSNEELNCFINDAKNVMKLGGFNLRGWEFSRDNSPNNQSNVLGMIWNKEDDTLSVNMSNLNDFDTTSVTKRSILSAAHRVFDPLGICCAITILPRILLQETWAMGLSWDQEVDESIKIKFRKWVDSLKRANKICIPRCCVGNLSEHDDVSLHTFVDASKSAYAAVIFLRVQRQSDVDVMFVQAKSRVAPSKNGTSHHSIPRLELLAATIGARLTASVVKNLDIKDLKVYYWSDSSTVIAWIHRENNWATFVWNRVKEIRALSTPSQWRHVPGILNPADLPSRGVNIEQFVSSKWWEGPIWLKYDIERWPKETLEFDENEIKKELKKTPVKSLISLLATDSMNLVFSFHKFSSYNKILRVLAWIKRFYYNARKVNIVNSKILSAQEIINAETSVAKLIQEQAFQGVQDKNIRSLEPFLDEMGVIRLKSRIMLRDDKYGFKYPIVLPRNNHIVRLLIKKVHEEFKHAGVEILLSALRENYWVLGGRKEIRSVITKCENCRRYDAKALSASPAPLPLDRVRDAKVFEVVGVDFAGPIFLKGNQKVWICVFTCAVYRAIHLELANSLSTTCFLMALRRFIARRGRPSVIYSDNGGNFTGLNNKLNCLNVEKVAENVAMQKIEWRFNPPSAAWWGGFWERLIGVLKRLLRRTLKKSCLDYEEMLTILLDCEAVINSRPITFMSDASNELIPLTPSHFLQDVQEIGVIDLDKIEDCKLGQREKYRLKIKNCLRKRFRSEYLGALRNYKPKSKISGNDSVKLEVNDIVFIGSDNCKRLDWPLAKVKEIIPGKDGKIRVVRLSTANGELVRPIQRLYPLEAQSKFNEEPDVLENPIKNVNFITRAGRKTKKPERLIY